MYLDIINKEYGNGWVWVVSDGKICGQFFEIFTIFWVEKVFIELGVSLDMDKLCFQVKKFTFLFKL